MYVCIFFVPLNVMQYIMEIRQLRNQCSPRQLHFRPWNANVTNDIRVCCLPRAARISFTVYATNENQNSDGATVTAINPKDIPLGWLVCLSFFIELTCLEYTLFDHDNIMLISFTSTLGTS